MKKDLFDSLNLKMPKFDPNSECLVSQRLIANPYPLAERNTMSTRAPVSPDCAAKSNWLRANHRNSTETISISASLLSQFKPISGTPERLGQQAYNFLNLGKLQSPENKAWADRLWESDGDVARIMIAKVVDYNN